MRDHNSIAWTVDRVEELSRLWTAGKSASEIAKVFGCTRNAVCGKVWRLSLDRPQAAKIAATARFLRMQQPGVKKPRRKSPKSKAKPRPNNFAAINAERMAKAKRPELPAAIIADASLAKPWTERRFGECAWIIAGQGAEAVSCCKPIHKRSWCLGHFKLGTTPRSGSPAKYAEYMARRAA